MPTREHVHRGTTYQLSLAHPVADFYPWPSEDEIDGIAADIKTHGQKLPIRTLPDGRVLDGRTRELCCRVAGVTPNYQKSLLTGEAEIVKFIQSANDHRRHLTPSQRAAVAAQYATLGVGRPNEKQIGNVADLAPVMTQAAAAKQFDVSTRLVGAAVGVKEHAPELFDAVRNGTLPVSTAAKASILPPRVRAEIAKSPDVKKAAEKALRDRPKHKPTPKPKPRVEDDVEEPSAPSPETVSEALGQLADANASLRAAEQSVRRFLELLAPNDTPRRFNTALEEVFQEVERMREGVGALA